MSTKRDTDREILDVKGAAELLGKSSATIYRMVAQGGLPFRRAGGKRSALMFSRAALMRWIGS